MRPVFLGREKRKSGASLTHCSHRRQHGKSKVLGVSARRNATDNLCPILNRLPGILSRLVSFSEGVSERIMDEIYLPSSKTLEDDTCMLSNLQV